ncbi:outer membrane beta-barrel protein [Aristophania vespae]|uniref:Outer membrane beta-barrel protein n=1 Tax=Aristophania vespae TaxID=2697033 RepID=A0A6P1NMX3_9PROT|nr:OmpW family outer membrane protein [Aristophania vespae]QHI96201.1 outer membrane beta-barrel protein [Aristophania vespae]
MQRGTLKTSIMALGLLAGSAYAQTPAATVATMPQQTQGTVTATSPYQAAPDATVHLSAPKSQSCGIFETCENTKIGLGKGDFLIRLSALGVITNNTSSSVNIKGGPAAGNQGHITATNQVAPEFTFEYFFTDNISLDLIAASTRHEAKAHNTSAQALLKNGDLGSFWVLPPTLTVAWHFRPHKRFNPYLGVGLTVAFFHNASPAQPNASLRLFDHLKPQTTVGPSFNAGFDYQVVGNWFFNMDVKQILLHTPIYVNHRDNPTTGGRIHARDSINPTTVSAGIEYRF